MSEELTLGSLFDGSGGFPLGGLSAGIKPVWASEIEPFPIRVTTKRLPQVKHYGDVSKINGTEVEPVDIITWGSPCTDLSIAGKREGLSGKQSRLYVEAVRIIREMLNSTNGEYPHYCVFENVPGLLSSNNGKDLITCLDMMQDLGFVPDPNILDAQDMGVPQRRKRVYITWLNVDYILRKKTIISDSITLQLLTELLQINLAELLKAFTDVPKKSALHDAKFQGNGLKKRIKLFSLQKEDHLQKLQRSLKEMQATFSNERTSSDLFHGDAPMEDIILTKEDMLSLGLTERAQYTNIGKLLRIALDESSQVMNESITSTWSKQTITSKIYFYFQALLNTLDVTNCLIHSYPKGKMSQNYYEWVKYTLIEMRDFIYVKSCFQNLPYFAVLTSFFT